MKIFFSNFLSNESEIRNEGYKVCGGTNKLPDAKKLQCSTFKIVTCEFFFFKIFRNKTQKLCILQKHPMKINLFFTFYISVPNFRGLGSIIYIFFQNRFGPLNLLVWMTNQNPICLWTSDVASSLSHRKNMCWLCHTYILDRQRIFLMITQYFCHCVGLKIVWDKIAETLFVRGWHNGGSIACRPCTKRRNNLCRGKIFLFIKI